MKENSRYILQTGKNAGICLPGWEQYAKLLLLFALLG